MEMYIKTKTNLRDSCEITANFVLFVGINNFRLNCFLREIKEPYWITMGWVYIFGISTQLPFCDFNEGSKLNSEQNSQE